MDKPIVFSSLDEFRIIFRHRGMTEQENSYSKTDVEEATLAYFTTHESASRLEITRSAGVSDKTASKYRMAMIEAELLEGSDKLRSGVVSHFVNCAPFDGHSAWSCGQRNARLRDCLNNSPQEIAVMLKGFLNLGSALT